MINNRKMTQTKFHSTSCHYEKNLDSRTTSHRARSEIINVIQPKCWGDKLFVELSFYELSVFMNNIFSIFDLSMKSSASTKYIVAVKQQHCIQCSNIEQQHRDHCKIKNLTKITQLIWKGLI